MSYILDALKRAEAERERGAVPGLNTQPTPMPAPSAATGPRQPLGWALGALLLVGMAGAAWWLWQPSASTPAPKPVLATATPAASPAPAPVPAAVAPAAVVAPPASTPAPVPVALALAPPVASAPAPPPPVAVVPPAPAKTPTPAAQPSATASASASASPATPSAASNLPWMSDLPADLRGQLPKMTISGAVYSKDPAQRLLLINNQVFTQGGNVAPGLDLLEIQPHQAIFSFQGTRFRVNH